MSCSHWIQIIYFLSTRSYCDYTYKKLAQKDYTHKNWLGLGSYEGTSPVIESKGLWFHQVLVVTC